MLHDDCIFRFILSLEMYGIFHVYKHHLGWIAGTLLKSPLSRVPVN